MTTQRLIEMDYVKTWLVFFVLATVGSFLIGAILGVIVGGVLGGLGVSLKIIRIMTGVLGFLASIPVSYFCFRFAIKKFLLPRIGAEETAAAPPMPAN